MLLRTSAPDRRALQLKLVSIVAQRMFQVELRLGLSLRCYRFWPAASSLDGQNAAIVPACMVPASASIPRIAAWML